MPLFSQTHNFSNPIEDTENPLYSPTSSALVYLHEIVKKSQRSNITTTLVGDAKIRKRGKSRKDLEQKRITVSSYVKMLAQVVVHYDKGREEKKVKGGKDPKKELGSNVSTGDCLNFGPPTVKARTRPVRKTRKDPAAKALSPFRGVSPPATLQNPSAVVPDVLAQFKQLSSPQFHSIDISLPKIPSCDTRVGSLPSTVSTSASTDTSKTLSPILSFPPGLHGKQTVPSTNEHIAKPGLLNPHYSHAQPQLDANHHKLALPKSKPKKRSLSQAFPELLKKPTKFARSFACDPEPDVGEQTKPPDVRNSNAELEEEGSTLLRSLELELEDLKDIERGRKTLYTPGLVNKATKRQQSQMERGDDKLELKFREMEETVYGSSIGTETPRGYARLVERLDDMIPGIRLGERLTRLDKSMPPPQRYNRKEGRHQLTVNFLASEGLLNEQIMGLFRTSEVQRLDLQRSLAEMGGLNLGGRGVWDVLARPNSFLFLTEISFNNTPVMDFDLVKLGRLPRLAVLGLENTGIGDEGIFHLLALKHTLTYLGISNNPCVTDDAVPVFLILITEKLSHLGTVGTSIGMPGLRRMARVIQRDAKLVDVEIPEACERYIDQIPNLYLMHPQPPLITAPALCSRLSAGALKRNLEAHLGPNRNARVIAGSTESSRRLSGFPGLPGPAAAANVVRTAKEEKAEMCEQLRELLLRREVDLVVWGMVYGDGDLSGGHDANADAPGAGGQDEVMRYLDRNAQATASAAVRGLRAL